MTKFAKLLLAGVAAAMAVSGAQAAAPKLDTLYNWQLNAGVVYSDMYLHSAWLGSLRATSAAIGNNAAIETDGNLLFSNRQVQVADVGATLKAYVTGVQGDASLQAVGICNNASVKNKGSDWAVLNNVQVCGTFDPFAIANVTLQEVGGDATVSAVAIANNFTADLETDEVFSPSIQLNVAQTYSKVTANISDVAGDVTVTSAAIGNNIAITALNP